MRGVGITRHSLDYLARNWAQDAEQRILWVPVLLGCGVGLYFALPVEPPPWLGAGLTAFALLIAGAARRTHAICLMAFALAIAMCGLAAAQWRGASVAAPVLEGELGPVAVEGRVLRVEPYPKSGYRVLLDRLTIARLSADETPERVRLVVRAKGEPPRAGDRVGTRAVIMPPSGPLMPGAFDFSRHAWFQKLGGVGYAVARLTPVAGGPQNQMTAGGNLWPSNIWLGIERAREQIAQRIDTVLSGTTGAVAVALMTGRRSAIPEATLEDLRIAGLAHLLAISGLHVGIMAAAAFFVVRAILASVPALALRYPIKKWAALAAFGVAVFYTLISGATISTQRALAMTSLVLLGVIIDRRVITMRSVALIASALLLVTPEVLINVGFQMSFGAVIALVAVYEEVRERGLMAGFGTGWGRRGVKYVLALALTTVVADLATGIFSLFQFGRIGSFSLVANMLAVPLMGLIIMPAAMAAFVLMPFGLEPLALIPMAAGIDAVLASAHMVASWPGAAVHVGALPMAALALIVLGVLWVLLWRSSWRAFGAAPVLAGALMAWGASPPDLLVSAEGRVVALRTQDGSLAFSGRRMGGRGGRAERETWLKRLGLPDQISWAALEGREGSPLACDALGCIFAAKGRPVAIIRQSPAAREDCARANIVVALVPLYGWCDQAALSIDRFDLWRSGAHAIWLGDAIHVQSAAESQGLRPWSFWKGRS